MDIEPRRLGKYELRQPLARGGQGEVWKAFDPQLRRYVAIKQLHANVQSDPDFISRFEREARFIAALHHPNIVQIHDFQSIQLPGSDTTTAYMVMDYIEGPTLANYIHNTSCKGHFPDAADMVYIFTAVSLAIDYAHGQGMIHRDIKPANIMLDKRSLPAESIGHPILTDFGIAKLQGAFADTTKVLGTPLYTSPEQAQGLSGDKRSDLYSLGIILYEMTTGVTPFRGASPMAILMQHYQETPMPPAIFNPGIPPALSQVILKSIAKNPDARFQSASDLTIALAEALNVPVPAALRKTASSPLGTSPLPSPPSRFEHPPLPIILSPSVSTSLTHASSAPPMIPADSRSWTVQLSHPGMNVSGAIMPPPQATAPVAPPPVPPPANRRKKGLYIGLIALLIALVASASVLYALFAPKPPPTTSNPIAGHILFLHSPNAAPGNFDEVQITLQGIPDTPSGKTYYAWLENGTEDIPPVHWSFTVRGGKLSPSIYIDTPQHRNLFTRLPYHFLIILQSQETFVPPSQNDNNKRLYYASISPTTSSTPSFAIMQCPQSNADTICTQW